MEQVNTEINAQRRAEWIGGILSMIVFIGCSIMAVSYHGQDMYRALREGGDALGYYQYLPTMIGEMPYTKMPWTAPIENGNLLSMFTMGVALLQLPFFLLGCFFSWVAGTPIDGYSEPFALAMMMGTATYVAIGCNLLFHFLRRPFGLWPSVVAVTALLVCTNLWFYSTQNFGMSHAYSFFGCSLLVYLSRRMIEAPNARDLFGIVVVGAWITLVRQLNGVVLLFPLLYAARSRADVIERLRWPLRFRKATILGVVAALIIWSPQLMYWHAVTGDFLTFTYGHKGERFYWGSPHFIDLLFSSRNGWFLYTPLMLVVMGALLWMAWKKVTGARTVLLIWALVWWFYASWWCWWLGGAFGHRGFVEHYAFLALPLAWLVMRLWPRGWIARAPLLALFLFLAVINIRLTGDFNWEWSEEHWNWDRLVGLYGSIL